MTIRKAVETILLAGAMLAAPTILPAQQEMRTTDPWNAEKRLRSVRTATGISYPEGAKITVELAGTRLDPAAHGQAKVERRRGETDIKIKMDEIKPATNFGGDYATYVLWVVSPEGHLDNAGEFIVRGDEIKLDVTTPLQTFGMLVTAEPHFLVSTPSQMVVMENTKPKNDITGQVLKGSMIKYRGMDGIYAYDRPTLEGLKPGKGEVRTDVKQAKVSIRLAKAAGAQEYAPEPLQEAEVKFADLIDAVEAEVPDSIAMTMGHEVVRLAYDAQKQAEEKAFQAALDAERAEHASEIDGLETRIGDAQDEAEKARLLAEQRQMELEMEQRARQSAADEAADTARQLAEEARLRREAEQRAYASQQEADRLAAKSIQLDEQRRDAERAAQLARDEAERALAEREAARERMRTALSQIVETRESARGLIVNLPDILFDFGKATLQPEARETISRMCGVLSVIGGYDLSVEGHTDSVGSDEFNQSLSESRAGAVQEYFDGCQIPDMTVTATGFGESKPVADNNTNEGRQKNRRVEIVFAEQALELSELR